MVGVAQFGRAPGCGPGGRGFKSHHSPHKKIKGHCNTAMAFVPFAPVAQLDRAPDFESVGRPFESGRAYQLLVKTKGCRHNLQPFVFVKPSYNVYIIFYISKRLI